MRLHLNKTLKAALIAAVSVVGFTITQAQAADSGSITLHVNNTPGWSTGTDAATVYSYLDSTFNDGGTLTFTMNVTWDGKTCNHYQELLHVGMKGTGFYISANGSNHLLVGPATDHGGNHELSSPTLTANTLTPITVTLTNLEEGKASAQITLGGSTYSVADLTWSSMNWHSSQGERNKYSIGCGGSGWATEFKMEHLTIENNNVVATYTAPAPVEGLVWAGNATSSVWNTTDPNWSKGADPVAFTTGDNVAFDNTAEVKKVTLGDNITAGVVTVNAAAYEFAMEGNTLTATKLALSGDNASLSLSGTGKVSAESISAQGKTITIGSGVVLTGAGSGTLAGEGTFALASGTKSLGSISLGSDWTGYVRLSEVSFANDNLDTLARNGASTVEMNGITGGYAANWNGGTVHAKIRLTNPSGTNDNIAWKWSDGTTADSATYPTVTFDGAWVGDGTFRLTEKRQCVTFSGNISGWDGAFDYRGKHGTKLTFAGNATTVNAAILNNGTNDASKAWKQFHLIVQNQATFNKAVGAYTLEIAASQSATFNGATNIANGVTMGDGATITVGETGTLTLGGTVTFGGNAIVNNGTVAFGNNLVFNLDGLTPSEEEAGVHTYTLFSGSTSVNLSTLGVANITLTGGTSGKDWTFSDHGTISWTLPSELEWDNGQGTDKWNSTDTNWGGSAFVDGATAQFYIDANASITEPVRATSIVVGKAGEDAVTVAISAEETGTLTAGTLQVDNGSLTTNVTIEGLGSNTVAAGSTWHIGADQTIAAGAIDGSVDVAQGKTVTLVQAATAKDLLLGITGQGNIALGTSVSFDSADDAAAASTKATGTLTLKEGVKLTVGNNKDKTASIASFNHVVMEQGAGIDTKSRLVEINNLTVNTDASHTDVIKMLDTYSKDEVGLNLKGTTTLNGNLEINSDWKYKVNIETLAGTGSLKLTGGNEEHRAVIGDVDINSLTVTDKMTNVDITGTVALSGVLGVNGTTNVTGENSMTVGGLTGSAALNVANGITFNVAEGGDYSYTGTLTVGGQIVKRGNGTQTIGGTALKHAVLAQAGTLVLNGTYEIKDIAEGEHQTIYVDADDQESPNGGFMKNTGSLTVYTVNTEAGAQLNLGNAVFTYDGNVVTEDVQDGAYTLPSAPILSTVYVKDGSLAFAAFKAKAGEALTTVSLANNTTIDMDEAATIELVLESGANATVNATAATTLNAVTGLAAAQQLVVSGDETVTLGSAVTGNKILVNNGHLNLGTLTHSLSELSVTNGTVDVGGVDSKYGCVSGTLTIGESGTVTTVGHHDVFGYNDGATDKIVLRGAENKLAQLVLNSPNANSVTMTTDIEMYGYSAITSSKGDSDKGFNTYGGTIKVEGLENSISVLDMRHNGVTIDVAENGALEIKKVTIFGNQHGANTILVKAGEGALTLSGASDLTDGLTINAGSVEIGGESTIGNLAGTGDLVVKAGGSLNVTGSVTDTNITVEDGGTIAGGVDAKNVGIVAGGTATFDEGIHEAGVDIEGWSSGATVKNNGDATAKYTGLQDSNMKVTADWLSFDGSEDTSIANQVDVDAIVNMSGHTLTLENAASLELSSVTLVGESSALALNYKDEQQAVQEGTVTITESLTAGGGVLLANLTVKGGSMLDMVSLDNELATVTLGSELSFAEDGLVSLSDEVITLLNGMEVDGYWDIFQTYGERDLEFVREYDGAWFDSLFNRSGDLVNVEGDFQIEATPDHFRLVKNSMVPEPTTGTLSLLALMALAARRRRH